MTLNACEFEIDLFCRGVRVPESVSLEGSRSFSRTRAGLGSGLEIAIPTGSRLKPLIYTNVPVVERFVAESPYELQGSPTSGYAIRDARNASAREVRVLPEPAWYQRLTSRDVPMSRIGVMQGTYLGIYVNPVCAFWTSDPPRPCAFCTTGQNVGEHETAEKTVEDVVETC